MEYIKLHRGYDCESEVVEETVQKLGDELGLRKESKKALKVLLLNLYFSDADRILISRTKNTKISKYMNPLGIGQKAMITALDKLSPKYIKQVIGKITEDTTTAIKATEELKSCFDHNNWSRKTIKLVVHHEPVVLKDDTRKKNAIDYNDTEYTVSVRRSLVEYMDLLANTRISYGQHREFDRPLVVRGYNKCSFERGGRIVGRWAHLTASERKTIFMDDEETVELDFPASTLNILYRYETGEGCPYNDPYPVRVNDIEVPKKFCKKLVTISLNVRSSSAASKVFRHELSDTDKREFDSLCVTTKDLHQAIKDKHEPIYGYFFKGADFGVWLQFIESELMFSILKRLTRDGIPSLTVYDSFIVRRRDEEYVQGVMNRMADDVTMAILARHPYKQES